MTPITIGRAPAPPPVAGVISPSNVWKRCIKGGAADAGNRPRKVKP